MVDYYKKALLFRWLPTAFPIPKKESPYVAMRQIAPNDRYGVVLKSLVSGSRQHDGRLLTPVNLDDHFIGSVLGYTTNATERCWVVLKVLAPTRTIAFDGISGIVILALASFRIKNVYP